MVRFDFDWQVEKYVLCCLYGILMVCSLVQLIRIKLAPQRREGLFFSMRVRLQVFLFLGITSRLVFMALPVSFYQSLNMSDVWIQVLMDLTPEVLFWLTYVLLVILWAAMYYGAINNNKDSLLNMVFYGIATATVVSVIVLALVMQKKRVYTVLVEAVYLLILSTFTIVAFAWYGFLLYLRARRLNINLKHKDTMLQKLKWIGIIVLACDVSHCVYLIVVDTLSSSQRRIPSFIVIWFFYFVLTENTPASIILYIFRKIPESSPSSSSSSSSSFHNNSSVYTPLRDPPKNSIIF